MKRIERKEPLGVTFRKLHGAEATLPNGLLPDVTHLFCGECGLEVEVVIRLGQQTGYDDPPTLDICPACLKKALALIDVDE
jgi:hypothetical protein